MRGESDGAECNAGDRLSVLTMQSFDRYRVGPEAVLADEDHLPGLREE